MSEPAANVRTVHVELPDELVQGANDELATRLRLLWLIDEVRGERMSTGRAAEVAGLPLAHFHRLLSQHGVATIRMTDDELQAEFDEVSAINGRHAG